MVKCFSSGTTSCVAKPKSAIFCKERRVKSFYVLHVQNTLKSYLYELVSNSKSELNIYLQANSSL